MDPILSNFYAMEEHRRKIRKQEAEKFKRANEKLNNSFYIHPPSPSVDRAIEHMYNNLAMHNQFFETIMEQEYGTSVSSSNDSSTCSSDTSSSDNSSSGSDSSSCSSGSSYD